MAIRTVSTDYSGLSELLHIAGENPSLLHKRIWRFNDALASSQRHYVVMDDNKIIAMGAGWLRPNFDGKAMLHFKHVSVDMAYWRHGHARQLLKMAFSDTHAHGAYFWNEGFDSDANRENLGGCMQKIAKQYPGMECFLN